MLLILGVLVVIGCVAGGFIWEGGALGALYQPAEFLIIGGAALGALLISTPTKLLVAMLSQIKALFSSGSTKAEYLDLLSMLYQLFKLIQQAGVMALEAHFEDPGKSTVLSKYPVFLARHEAFDFLADSVKVIIVGGIAPHDLEALMDEDLEVHHDEAMKPAGTINKVADALPGLGIVAAVLGVVITMGAIDGPPEEIGHKVGAALVGTFLGILMSYGFAQPMATKLEHHVADEGHYLQCIKTGLLSIYKGFPPAIAVEFARRVLPTDVRPSFDETEQACRAPKAPESMAA